MTDEPTDPTPRLCYVSGPWAYFTTQDVSKQWGDDWDDAPYEHNAGDPYQYQDYNRKRGDEPWNIVKVAWEGPFDSPDAWTMNSDYSVQQINARETPWLRGARHSVGEAAPPIWAGATLQEFIGAVQAARGTVYLPLA